MLLFWHRVRVTILRFRRRRRWLPIVLLLLLLLISLSRYGTDLTDSRRGGVGVPIAVLVTTVHIVHVIVVLRVSFMRARAGNNRTRVIFAKYVSRSPREHNIIHKRLDAWRGRDGRAVTIVFATTQRDNDTRHVYV